MLGLSFLSATSIIAGFLLEASFSGSFPIEEEMLKAPINYLFPVGTFYFFISIFWGCCYVDHCVDREKEERRVEAEKILPASRIVALDTEIWMKYNVNKQNDYQLEMIEVKGDDRFINIREALPKGTIAITNFENSPSGQHMGVAVVNNGSGWGDYSEHSFFTSFGPTTLYVPSDKSTIQGAVDSAFTGDTIMVAPGTYPQSVYITGKDLIILSSGGPEVTFVNSTGGIYFNSTLDSISSELSGFTIKSSNSYALRIVNSSPSVHDNIFTNNAGSYTLHSQGISSPHIYDNVFYSNSSNFTLRIGSSSGTAVIHHNLFMSNSGTGTANLFNMTLFYNNTIANSSAGILSYDTDNLVINNIIYGISTGGAILVNTGTIDYNNSYNCNPNYSADSNISVDPLFTDEGNFDFTLLPASLCIDAGHPDTIYNDPDGTRNDIGAFAFLYVNIPPQIDSIEPQLANEGQLFELGITAEDIDGYITSLSTYQMPEGALFVDSGNGAGGFTWIPNYNQAGIFEIYLVAIDDSLDSDTQMLSITVNNVNQPPMSQSLIYPLAYTGLQQYELKPTFVWRKTIDIDSLDTFFYKLQISTDSNFIFLSEVDSLSDTLHLAVDSLQLDTKYWWKVISTDNYGLSDTSTTNHFQTWLLGDMNISNTLNISDLTTLVNYMFKNGDPIIPSFIADLDGSCSVNIADLTYLVNYFFKGGNNIKIGCE